MQRAPPHPLPPASPFAARRTEFTLRRPYPLLLPLALDLASTLLYSHKLPLLLLLLCAVRVFVLLGLVTSQRWKAQGGILLSASGATLIACTWEACAPLLRREEGVKAYLLILTCGLAIFEYLLFLLLVRLTPSQFAPRPIPGSSLPSSPSITPLGSRTHLPPLFSTPIPHSAPAPATSNAGCGYTAYTAPGGLSLPSVSSYGQPLGPSSWSAYDSRDSSGVARADTDTETNTDTGTQVGNNTLDGEGLSSANQSYSYSRTHSRSHSHAYSHRDRAYGYDRGHDRGHDHDDSAYDSDTHSSCSSCSDCSSISESSIIDLPRPRPPAPIIVDSTSMSALAAVANGQVGVGVVGALVRRSASSRFSPDPDGERGERGERDGQTRGQAGLGLAGQAGLGQGQGHGQRQGQGQAGHGQGGYGTFEA